MINRGKDPEADQLVFNQSGGPTDRRGQPQGHVILCSHEFHSNGLCMDTDFSYWQAQRIRINMVTDSSLNSEGNRSHCFKQTQ